MGRKAKISIDNSVSHKTKEELELREKLTPKYLSQNFIAPPTLTKKELVVWNWLVDIFHETIDCRVSDADVHLMEFYCRAKVAADDADKALKKNADPFILVDAGENKDGDPRTVVKANPNIAKRKDNMELVRKYFAELGLSPTSRARQGLCAANANKTEDVFEKLMNRKD